MKKNGQRIQFYSMLIASAIFVLCMVLRFLGIFTFLENKSYDSRTRITAPFTKVSDDICFIGIDQESINSALAEKNWGWPWPRSAYADIVDFMREGNAKAVIFDVFFTEPSVYGASDDEAFVAACRKNGRVVQIMFKSEQKGNLLFPIDPIQKSAALIGNATSAKDSDDIIRRGRIAFTYDGKEYPSLGLAPVFLDSQDLSGDIESVRKEVRAALDDTVLLRYKGDLNRYAHYSAYDIIDSWNKYKKGEASELVPEDFADCIVYFIFYAPGLYDICSTPVSQIYPGSGVHITMLDNYLSGDFVRSLPLWLTVVYCLITSFGAALIVCVSEKKGFRHQSVFLMAAFLLGIILVFAVAYSLFIYNIFIEVIAPLFCFLLSYVSSVFVSYSLEGRQKRFIKSAFSQYLSPFVIDKLIQDPERLKLGGEKRHISIFFSDVQSFTTLSESLEPERLTEVLNKYLTEMSGIILESGGTIDKYEGDAIIAFWNAPTDIKNHARCAIEAAMKCQARLKEMEDEFIEMVGRPMWTRIGINTGDAVVGNMGSKLRFDYTMFGDSVNLASRLEGLNKQFGTYVMCSDQTRKEAVEQGCELCWRELARAGVVGKKEAVTVFQPLTKEEYESDKENVLAFGKGLEKYYAGDFKAAKEIFDSVKENDKPSYFYSKKCESFIQMPPEGEWLGVWRATEK